ncbi:TIGR00725 family protein, partial [candidate division KSB1 bacterium]
NLMVVRNSDAVIAMEGKYGTLSEMAMSLIYDLPLVCLGSWEFDGEYVRASDPEEAVQSAFRLIADQSTGAGK